MKDTTGVSPWRLHFFAGLLLASAFIACADVSSRLRRYTYPPDFIYIAEEQLRSTMWQLARDVRELDRTVRAPAPGIRKY
jgi:hypothetical protein